MNNWQKVKLKDVVSILGDGLHGTPTYDDSGEYFFINGNNLFSGKIKIKADTKRINANEYLKYKKELNDRTLLVSINGTIGNVATYRGEKCILGKSACYFNILPEVCKGYIYYILLHDDFQNYAKNWAAGTTIKNVSLKQMREYEFLLPSFEKQQQIVQILSSLDDKIELNAQINHNLEEQAKAIFREYFQPHEKVVPLGSICKCVLGGTPNRNKSEYWGGDIPWINSGKVNEFRITTASEYITDSGLKNSSTKLLPCHTTVIAITGATLGQVSLLEIASCANQSVVGVLQNDNVPYTFIYPFIKENILELISNQTGGAQQHINKQNVEALPVPCYSPDLISEYHEKISPLYGQISNNCFESERLTGLRDLLLPKLMSGEIDVSEVEI